MGPADASTTDATDPTAPPTVGVEEEFILVDGSGRVQIPRDVLDELSIGDRAHLRIEDGKVTIVSVD